MFIIMPLTLTLRVKYKMLVLRVYSEGQEPAYQQITNVRGHQSQLTSAEVFTSLGEKGNSHRIMRPCIFCHGNHYNDQCDKYVSLLARKKN